MKRRCIPYKLVLIFVIAITLLVPVVAYSASPWTKEQGVYVDDNGIVVEGALLKGISVSKYQGKINWQRVAKDDISFAMIRMGYLNSLDPTFDYNMKEAAANGVKTGVYLYSQALNEEIAIAEAKFAVRMAKDYQVSYPIAMDVESEYIAHLSRQELTDVINAFCKVVVDAGYHPIVFGYNDWFVNKMDTKQIPYDIWYARYGTVNYYENRTIWQCSDDGRVDGISEPVCIELAFKDYSETIPADGWRVIDCEWYYFSNYQKQTGWAEVAGQWYYLRSDGIMHTGWMNFGNDWYYFDSISGAMLRNQEAKLGGVDYHFGSDGRWIQ